jgi:hypothetical protein
VSLRDAVELREADAVEVGEVDALDEIETLIVLVRVELIELESVELCDVVRELVIVLVGELVTDALAVADALLDAVVLGEFELLVDRDEDTVLDTEVVAVD